MSKSPTTTEKGLALSVNLPPIHPGEHLWDELEEMGSSINAFARGPFRH